MADETMTNQRPAVIAAVIVAALTAAGLWYFFVFRPPEFNNIATETSPAISPASGVTDEATSLTPEIPESTSAVAGKTDLETPAPGSAGLPRITPEAAYIEPTAPTGPAHVAVAGAFLAMIAGLRGLWRTARARVLPTWTE